MEVTKGMAFGMLFIVSLLTIGACVFVNQTQDTVWNNGYEAGLHDGYSDKVNLGVPSEEWPGGDYIIWTTFNDSYLDNTTGTEDGGWHCNYEYTVAIPIYDNGTRRMYPRLLKEV